MSSETTTLTLSAHAMKVAKLELVEIARAGMAQHYHTMYDFEVVAYGTRTQYRDSIFDFLPRTLTNRESRMASGVFAGLGLNEILSLCFTQEAVDFFIDHAYNGHIFWSNIYHCVFSLFREDTAPLPLDLEAVKSRVLGDRTPFGVVSSPYSDHHMGRLKAAAKKNKGKFDPNKLPAAYAFELIRAGFLFRQKLEDYKQPSVLVVNPLWQHLLDDTGAATTTAGEKVPFTLAAHGNVTALMTIEPADGYTAEKVATMLTQRHALVQDSEVIVRDVAPKTGHTVIAKIINPDSAALQTSTPVWTVIR